MPHSSLNSQTTLILRYRNGNLLHFFHCNSLADKATTEAPPPGFVVFYRAEDALVIFQRLVIGISQ